VTCAIRDARDGDADGIIALIGAVYAEYPGCVLDVDREEPELRAIAAAYAAPDARFWVAEADGPGGRRVVACVGMRARGDVVDLKKLYMDASLRGSGLADQLHGLVLDEARRRGARAVELWSDTRFERAHRFYEKRGYVRGAATRDLHDVSATTEYFFRLTLERATIPKEKR